jgi:hypothetical protein
MRGRGERQTAELYPVSNCTHVMYSTSIDLSFSYLRSAVEASLVKKGSGRSEHQQSFLKKHKLYVMKNCISTVFMSTVR